MFDYFQDIKRGNKRGIFSRALKKDNFSLQNGTFVFQIMQKLHFWYFWQWIFLNRKKEYIL